MKLLSSLGKNWKKTALGLCLGAYGFHYGREMHQISEAMKSYSKLASIYGEQCDHFPKRLTVILNPAANKKQSEKFFKKYCAPILHLAGFAVDIVRTDSEGYAKTYMEQLKILPDAVLIAGGDGTVLEVLTGMMRRKSDRCPIALLPLGMRNDIAKKYLNVSFSSKLKEVEALLNASMIMVRGCIAEKGVIKIEQISAENDVHSEIKPIYAMGYLQWGIDRDIKSLQEKYWYFGNAKTSCSILLNAFNSNLSWNCKANVFYSLPCIGCTNCVNSDNRSKLKKTWWTSVFVSNVSNNQNPVLSNNDCKLQYNDNIDSSNICIYLDEKTNPNKLVLKQEDNVEPGYSFLHKHLVEPQTVSGERNIRQSIECRTLTLVPDDNCKGSSKFYSIDNEVYDVRPISLTLIPKAIQLYV